MHEQTPSELVEERPADSAGAAAGERELTSAALSAEAARLRDGCGLPLRPLPLPRSGSPAALSAHTLGLNQLIAGGASSCRIRDLLGRHLPERTAEFASRFAAHFEPLWRREELEAMRHREPRFLYDEWRRRLGAHSAGARLTALLQPHLDAAAIWPSLPVGDFDATGRGRDYTAGMAYFQAARAFGIEGLLGLFGGLAPGADGIYLDVLGGDGYILRILEASRAMRAERLLLVPVATTAWSESDLAAAAATLPEVPPGGLLALAVAAPENGDGHWSARLLAWTAAGLAASPRFALAAADLAALAAEPTVRRLGEHPLPDLPALVAAMGRHLQATAGPARRPLMVTNDIAPHMFYSAGLWGPPTREDARALSRTFRDGAFDGVLFAYGTHHVTAVDRAVAESLAILAPGGRIVVHDFLDEGQVGRWFHQVVDRHSRTGHDFPHLGPVELAVYLYLAGFRDVELYEMEDPFVFAVPDGSEADARDVATTYLLGMYGMGERLGGDRDRFERLVREYLTYPEIGNEPHFAPDLVYVPRRATVATARHPASPAGPLSAADAHLVARLADLLAANPADLLARTRPPADVAASWYPSTSARFGLSPEFQRRWFQWLGGSR
jgi:SAM-dependent methyltransferase